MFKSFFLGILSEEASEARNKDFRNVRQRHTRKIGRKETNVDIIHSLLVSSDPFISLIKPKYSKRQNQDLLPEAIQLLDIEKNFDVEEDEVINIDNIENIPDPLSN